MKIAFIGSVITAVLIGVAAPASAQGRFSGNVVAQWRDADRTMQLTQDFSFVEDSGKRWDVPSGTVVDGASIPRVFWTIVGSPFTGNYRKASVIHDYFCEGMSRPWQEVHRVFFDAQLVEGNNLYHAKLLYAAVYAWGPRWETVNGRPTRTRDIVEIPPREKVDELATWIRDNDPSLLQIEASSDQKFPR